MKVLLDEVIVGRAITTTPNSRKYGKSIQIDTKKNIFNLDLPEGKYKVCVEKDD